MSVFIIKGSGQTISENNENLNNWGYKNQNVCGHIWLKYVMNTSIYMYLCIWKEVFYSMYRYVQDYTSCSQLDPMLYNHVYTSMWFHHHKQILGQNYCKFHIGMKNLCVLSTYLPQVNILALQIKKTISIYFWEIK